MLSSHPARLDKKTPVFDAACYEGESIRHATAAHTPRSKCHRPRKRKKRRSAIESCRETTNYRRIEGENEFATLARQHWLKSSRRTAKVSVKNDVLKREIWDPLEKENFPLKSLLVLEGLQTLERYARVLSSTFLL